MLENLSLKNNLCSVFLKNHAWWDGQSKSETEDQEMMTWKHLWCHLPPKWNIDVTTLQCWCWHCCWCIPYAHNRLPSCVFLLSSIQWEAATNSIPCLVAYTNYVITFFLSMKCCDAVRTNFAWSFSPTWSRQGGWTTSLVHVRRGWVANTRPREI